MRNLLLTALLAATPAGAQEFSLDMPALSAVLAEARVLKVKHDGRPRPPLVSDYDPRDLSFELREDGSGRDEGGVYVNKSLELRHRGSPLATLRLNDDPRGWPAARRLLEAFESLRRDAQARGRRVVIDHDAIARQNERFDWAVAKDPRHCDLFDEVIRLGRVAGL